MNGWLSIAWVTFFIEKETKYKSFVKPEDGDGNYTVFGVAMWEN